MELNTVDRLRVVSDGSEGRVAGLTDGMEVWWRLGQLVAVGHPNLHLIPETFEQRIRGRIRASYFADLDVRETVFTVVALSDLSLQVPCDLLLPHTDGEEMQEQSGTT